MRIAIIQRLTLAHGIRGGMEIQAQSLAEGLAERGHQLLILTTPHPAGLTQEHEQDIPVRYLSPGSFRRYRYRWWAAVYQELTREHRREPFDVLLSQSAGALPFLPRASKHLDLPSVVVIHGTLRGALRTHWRVAASLRGSLRLLRLLPQLATHFVLWRRAARTVERWITVSSEVADEWRQELGLSAARLVVIPNGVDTTIFRPDPAARAAVRARLGLAEATPLLIATGRLEQEKGFQVAVAAVRQLQGDFPDLHLLIAGDGPYRRQLEQVAAELGSSVILLGHLPNSELPPILSAGDLYVMPTLRSEGLPMTIVEAMAAGLPVIASGEGGVRSTVDHGKTGMLVTRGDSRMLAEAISRLLKNPGLRAQMASAAREAALTRFSREQMISAVEYVLQAAVRQA